jgi:uncharacterized membrane protein YkoI
MIESAFKIGFAAVVVLSISSVALCEEKEDSKVALDQAPAAVQAAVKKVIGTNKMEELTKETEDGKVVYEVEFEANDVDHSASISEDGKVLEEEMEVEMKDLPAAVAKAFKDAAGKDGEVEEAEKVMADGKTFYEAEVESGEETFEVKVAEDGKVLSKTKEKEDDDKDEKNEKGEKGEHEEKEDKEHHEKK